MRNRYGINNYLKEQRKRQNKGNIKQRIQKIQLNQLPEFAPQQLEKKPYSRFFRTVINL